ncbi:tRNA pseudouridine synthase A [Paenibacillus curdlanolyticus YK9]|uniref:tRNA pseudouridine synthase A n=1 Tax=Paenibacillus curdlanolyticus YK9 TaxID=717606 RepID=E0I8F6_9BACL|nr:tRNA pseudouridine(38-40) synthase TruA [Paenibacillus curdlanolyticus]EFM11461.1 tRNA pseudouridine synthase A [Paenibacillus curdlanolyticus YK9]
MSRNIVMTVSYDGTTYSGFQSQPSGNTIQDIVETAIHSLTGEQLRIIGSGRTDAGVHARGQVFNFHTESRIPQERWALAMNTRLPDDIVILEAWEAPEAFHARHSAKRKTYRYTIDRRKFPDVFSRMYAFHHPTPLQVGAMREALTHLIGEHDFTSFTSIQSTQPHHVRTIFEAWLEEDGPLLYLFVTGNGFLYNMVRIIAGTMMWVGEGKLAPADIPAMLAAVDRTCAGPTAMAHGLMLWNVEYPAE